MEKPTICLGENKGADQLRRNCEADQRLCFRYTDTCSTISHLLQSKISSIQPASMTVQPGLWQTWSKTQIFAFLTHRLIFNDICSYEYLVIYHTKLKKPRYELEIVCIKTDTEKQDLEEKRRLGSQLTDLIHKITELIVGIQIMNYAGLVSAKKSSLLRNSQGRYIRKTCS